MHRAAKQRHEKLGARQDRQGVCACAPAACVRVVWLVHFSDTLEQRGTGVMGAKSQAARAVVVRARRETISANARCGSSRC